MLLGLYDKQTIFLLYTYTCNYSSLVGSAHYSSQLDDKKKVVTPWFNRPTLFNRSLSSGIVCTGKNIVIAKPIDTRLTITGRADLAAAYLKRRYWFPCQFRPVSWLYTNTLSPLT